ncbi:hypothetical protein PMAYCL1PPCAC_02687 [Pristionchus mayeri]|uniref:Nuclear nucleic acid-binding protein C1D n=1 Tax=Pristionchus mayeri TaxID=1317129 RepID=A0AAN5C756_9BILA|nr:hypothetical protein PMAYCL1PPCAC_02687 [Pristionchus mayeri]
MSESASTAAGKSSETATIPPEVVAKLKIFNDALTALEDALEPHLNSNFEEHMDRDPTELARIDVMSLFSVNSLAWSLLALKGQDPRKNEALQAELERTKTYASRLQTEESRREQVGVNQKVAKALIRNAVFDAKEYAEKKNNKE